MSTEMAPPPGTSSASDGALALANEAIAEGQGGRGRAPAPPDNLPPPRRRLPTLEGLAPPAAGSHAPDLDDPTNPDEAEWELTSELRAKPFSSLAEAAPRSYASDARATEPLATAKLFQPDDEDDDGDFDDLTSVYVRGDSDDDDDDFNDEETFVASAPSDAAPTAPKQLPPLAGPARSLAPPPPPPPPRGGGLPSLGVPARPGALPPPPLGAAARVSALPPGLLGMAARSAAPPPPPPPAATRTVPPPPMLGSRAPAPPARPSSVPPPPAGFRSAVPAPPGARTRSVLPPSQLTQLSAAPPPPPTHGTLPPPPRSSSPPPAMITAPPPPRTPGWTDHAQNSPFAVRPLTAPVAHPSTPPPPQGSSIAPVALGRESQPSAFTAGLFTIPRKRMAQLGALALLVVGLLGTVIVLLKDPDASAAAGGDDARVTVTVAGEDGAPLSDLSIVADDVVRCTTTPCKISDLAAGTHFIRVTADGYTATAARAVAVTDDEQQTLHFQLSRIPKPTPAVARDPEPVAPAAAPARAEETPAIDLDADEASPSTVAEESRPARTPRTARQQASRARSAAAQEPRAVAKRAVVEDDAEKPAALSQLNISSTPSTSVVLDGRPLGRTPISGVKVSPGAHTIVFIGPEGKRKVGTATVKPGATRTIAVKF